MPLYVGLLKFTAKGAADMKGWPKRVDEAKAAWEAMGGTTIAVVATMGEYDMVTVGEAPSDEIAVTWAAGVTANGYMTTTTLKGFGMEEMGALLARLP